MTARVEKLENFINNSAVTVTQTSKQPVSNELQKNISAKPQKRKTTENILVEDNTNKTVADKIETTEPAQKPNVEISDFPNWQEFVSELSNTPLFGLLANSYAQIGGDCIYITLSMPMAAKMLKTDGLSQTLRDALEKKTGVRYRILARNANSNDQQHEDKDSEKLSDILENAKNSGIEVNLINN